jgi:hypothetical protein
MALYVIHIQPILNTLLHRDKNLNIKFSTYGRARKIKQDDRPLHCLRGLERIRLRYDLCTARFWKRQ